MRIVYGLGVLLEAILIAHCAIGSFKKHDRLGKSVCIYETLTFACAIVFFVFTFCAGAHCYSTCERAYYGSV